MPKKPTDYKMTIMYKIQCKNPGIKDCYVGYTTDLIRKKQFHKRICNEPNHKEYGSHLYRCIRDNGGFDNWELIKIEWYPCETQKEVEERLSLLRDSYGSNLEYEPVVQPKESEEPEKAKYPKVAEVLPDESLEAKLLRKMNEQRKNSTSKNYLSRIKTIFNKGVNLPFPDTYKDIVDLLYENKMNVIIWVQDNYQVNYQVTAIRAVLVLLDIIKDEGSIECEKCNEFYKEYYLSIQKKDQDKQVYRESKDISVTPEEIKGVFLSLYQRYQEGYLSHVERLQFLIMSFYYYLPPLRGQELYDTVIHSQPTNLPDENYLDLLNNRLVIKDHKTRKSYGTHIVELENKEHQAIIKEWVDYMSLEEGEYLLLNPNNRMKMTSRMFGYYLKKKVGVSVTYLRNLYVSKILDKWHKEVAERKISQSDMNEKRKNLAKQMGHSLGVQETIYSKLRI